MTIRLGILGQSEGNGHPWSWSAIINGYDRLAMARCPFPIIPQYLGEQAWPDAAIDGAEVTAVWTQDRGASEAIAAATHISCVVDTPEDLIGRVDAVLLARDDPECHLAMTQPFLEAGLPIYVDKPLATSLLNAREILAHRQWPTQLFTCSALAYAPELDPGAFRGEIGELGAAECFAPKDWARYAVHVVEPLMARLGLTGPRLLSASSPGPGMRKVSVAFDDLPVATFTTSGRSVSAPIAILLLGSHGHRWMTFRDPFRAFRAALVDFLETVRDPDHVPRSDAFVLDVVRVIEMGVEGTG